MHPVVHLELHARDRTAAGAFLTEVVHWQPELIESGCGSYVALELGRGLGGGIVECGTRRAVWIPYVEVDRIEDQTEQVLANLRAILEEAGTSLERLVKTTVFLQDLGDFQGMNSVYAKHVGDRPPARSTVEVAKLPSGAKVEIEAIAQL